jgi:hypothetical protein
MRISAQWRSALSKGARVYKQGSRSIAIRPHPPHHSTIPIRPFSEMASLQPTISASSENGKADVNNNHGVQGRPRNIVILLDGTANQFSDKNSNLIKLMSVLKADETQLLYYSSGLGRWLHTLADVELTPRHGAAGGYEHMEQVEGEDRRGNGHGVCLVSRDDPLGSFQAAGRTDKPLNSKHHADGRNFEAFVCDAYKFLVDYYQTGDKIYLFGFSRGAYTARALAGMIQRVSTA